MIEKSRVKEHAVPLQMEGTVMMTYPDLYLKNLILLLFFLLTMHKISEEEGIKR